VVSAEHTVTVAVVYPADRTGPLEGVAWAVVEMEGGRHYRYHVPSTAATKAMTLDRYARYVASVEGLRFVEPGPWAPGGPADDYADAPEDGNGLVRNRHVRRPARAGAPA